MEAVPTIWDEQLKQAPVHQTLGNLKPPPLKKPKKFEHPAMIPTEF